MSVCERVSQCRCAQESGPHSHSKGPTVGRPAGHQAGKSSPIHRFPCPRAVPTPTGGGPLGTGPASSPAARRMCGGGGVQGGMGTRAFGGVLGAKLVELVCLFGRGSFGHEAPAPPGKPARLGCGNGRRARLRLRQRVGAGETAAAGVVEEDAGGGAWENGSSFAASCRICLRRSRIRVTKSASETAAAERLRPRRPIPSNSAIKASKTDAAASAAAEASMLADCCCSMWGECITLPGHGVTTMAATKRHSLSKLSDSGFNTQVESHACI